jgi:predicted nuclease of predicted toxin-antitoxin system
VSFSSKQPDESVFFLDRSLGKKKVAQALREAGVVVEVHDDHFPVDAQDQVWLREVGRHGWVVLTKDRKIRYRKVESTALLQEGVRAFVLTAGEIRGEEVARIFVTSLPKILRFVRRHRAPFIAALSRSGSIRLLVAGHRERPRRNHRR